MEKYNFISECEKNFLNKKKIMLRVDCNVPVQNNKITDDSRIKAIIPTIKFLLKNNTSIIIITHFGRPKGNIVESLRVDIIVKRLSELLNHNIVKYNNCIGIEVENAKKNIQPQEIIFLENTRFHKEETNNNKQFSEELSKNTDIFIQDAFGCVHRSHSSTEGITKFLPSYMGLLLETEYRVLNKFLKGRNKNMSLIIGGAKIDTKIGLIQTFLPLVKNICIGGGLANTFLAAKGYEIQDSLVEKDKIPLAKEILENSDNKIILPTDVIVSKEINETSKTKLINLLNNENLEKGDKILDIGKETINKFNLIIKESESLLWNGPLGLFEYTPFSNGTKEIIETISYNYKNIISIVGGGDSIDAIHRFNIDESLFFHISTGGGAMLEFLEGKELPGIRGLQKIL
jgi:phosphoglycerate kinase